MSLSHKIFNLRSTVLRLAKIPPRQIPFSVVHMQVLDLHFVITLLHDLGGMLLTATAPDRNGLVSMSSLCHLLRPIAFGGLSYDKTNCRGSDEGPQTLNDRLFG